MPTSAETPVRLFMRARGGLAFFPGVEPVPWSLPWPEPAHCRALFEAVFWKPRVRWDVRELWILRPPRFVRMVCPADAPPLGLRAGEPLWGLAEVDYRVEAELWLNPGVVRRDASDNHGKYAAIFGRRLARGQHHHPAFFGLRPLLATLAPCAGDERPTPIDIDFGPMRADWGGPPLWARAEAGVVRFGS